jgi:hypothetical protein
MPFRGVSKIPPFFSFPFTPSHSQPYIKVFPLSYVILTEIAKIRLRFLFPLAQCKHTIQS